MSTVISKKCGKWNVDYGDGTEQDFLDLDSAKHAARKDGRPYAVEGDLDPVVESEVPEAD